MAYISRKPPLYPSKSERKSFLANLDGGVCYSNYPDLIADNQSPDMKNLWFENNLLCTRYGQKKVFDLEGQIYSMTKSEFYGHMILHVAENVYAWNGIGEPFIIGEMFDEKSLLFEMNSTIYFLCRKKVFSVSEKIEFAEVFPDVPLIASDCDAYDMKKYTLRESPNLLTRRVKISYLIPSKEPDIGIPFEFDPDCEFEIYNNGEKLDKSKYYINGTRAYFYSSLNSPENNLEFIFDVKQDSEFDLTDKIYNCTVAETYGGTNPSGTRLFMSGNSSLPGHYFKSELANPLHFKELEFDIIGNGNDNITAFAKQYGDLILFTERATYRMRYYFSISEGAQFTLKELNSQIGCDMPGSIQLIDNRVVFANSAGGVYIIDSNENFDEQNIKPISQNIMGKKGINGFLNESEEDLISCCSCDFDRRYMLCIADHVYVWDYGLRSYYDNGNYSDAQQRLKWFFFDSISAKDFFIKSNELFYYSSVQDGGFIAFCDSPYDFGNKIPCYITTKAYSMNIPHMKKILRKLKFNTIFSGGGNLKISCFADRKGIFEKYLYTNNFSWKHLSWNKFSFSVKKDLQSIYLKIVPYKAFAFSFKIENISGVFSVSDLYLSYITTDKL